LLQALDAQSLAVELNYNFTNVTTLIAMVDAGLGAAVFPSSAAPQRDELKVLRLIPFVVIRCRQPQRVL